MSYSDIRENLEDIYQIPISNGMINKITDRLLPVSTANKSDTVVTSY